MSDPTAILGERLAEIWRRSRPSVLERVDILRSVYEQLGIDAQNMEAQQRGREAAHKLAGILGVFGLSEAGEIASEIEGLLTSAMPLKASDLAEFGEQLARVETLVASKPAP